MNCPECKRLELKAAQAAKELVSAQNALGAAEATSRREQRATVKARARAAETHRDQALREIEAHKRNCAAGSTT
jgi:hypothetical protein